MKNITLFFFISLFLSCLKNNQNQITLNLNLLNSHTENYDNGKNVFNNYCSTCHLYGTGGAILINDKARWNNLIKDKKSEEIFKNVVMGYIGEKGPMPSMGGCHICTQEDLLDAIYYIFNINQLRFNN